MPVMVETILLMPVVIIHEDLHWVRLCGDDDVCEHDQKIASLSFELCWTELKDPDLV